MPEIVFINLETASHHYLKKPQANKWLLHVWGSSAELCPFQAMEAKKIPKLLTSRCILKSSWLHSALATNLKARLQGTFYHIPSEEFECALIIFCATASNSSSWFQQICARGDITSYKVASLHPHTLCPPGNTPAHSMFLLSSLWLSRSSWCDSLVPVTLQMP